MTQLQIPEDDIQRTIIEGLRALSYDVRCTTVRGWKGGRGYGTSKGIPDLLVTRYGWGCTCELEVKKSAKAKVRPEQQEYAAQGVMTIVISLDEAMAAVAAFERRHGLKGACSMRVSA